MDTGETPHPEPVRCTSPTPGKGQGATCVTHRVTVRLGSVSGGRTCASSRLLHTTLPSAPAALPVPRARPSCLQPAGSAATPRSPPVHSRASSASGSSSGGSMPLAGPASRAARGTGLAGGGGASRARRWPEPPGGPRTDPAPQRHAPLSAAALALREDAGSGPPGRSSLLGRREHRLLPTGSSPRGRSTHTSPARSPSRGRPDPDPGTPPGPGRNSATLALGGRKF